ncbi:MAG: hypothetical protein IH608_04435, partial [Proteobacteria bacterium]|nr:hypothetical protein [Pseudomonadota bacterium]
TGKPARTHFDVLERFAVATLLRCRLETGRTHQIRVHLASLGHPVVGDPVYGGTRRAKGAADPAVRRRLAAETGQALHAWRLTFRHPGSGQELTFEAPVPEAMASLIRDLGGEVPGGRVG